MVGQASVFCQLLQVFSRVRFAQLVKKHGTEHGSKGFSSWTQFVSMLFCFKNKLLSIDATVIDLCLSMFPWAQFRTTKGAVKLHLLLDHDGYLPAYVWIREAAVHEIHFARSLRDCPDRKIQIWTALIAMLLLKYLQFKSRHKWSLSNLVFLLQRNLFTYRILWDWLDHPFVTPPLQPESFQPLLPIPGLGQHVVKS